MSRISTPDYSLRLKDALGVRGLPPVHNVDETIIPVILIDDLTNSLRARTSRERVYSIDVLFAPGVGNNAMVSLRCRAASSVFVLPRRIRVFSTAAGGGYDGLVRLGTLGIAEGATAAGIASHDRTEPGDLGTPQAELRVNTTAILLPGAEVNLDRFSTFTIDRDKLEWNSVVLGPTKAIWIQVNAQNTSLLCSFMWAEVPAQP